MPHADTAAEIASRHYIALRDVKAILVVVRRSVAELGRITGVEVVRDRGATPGYLISDLLRITAAVKKTQALNKRISRDLDALAAGAQT